MQFIFSGFDIINTRSYLFRGGGIRDKGNIQATMGQSEITLLNWPKHNLVYFLVELIPVI